MSDAIAFVGNKNDKLPELPSFTRLVPLCALVEMHCACRLLTEVIVMNKIMRIQSRNIRFSRVMVLMVDLLVILLRKFCNPPDISLPLSDYIILV